MRVRSSVWRWTVVSLASLLGSLLAAMQGCLVTDKIEFGEPNFPTRVVIEAPLDNSKLLRVPERSECGEGEDISGGEISEPWMSFRVAISDPNRDDQLAWRMIVNGVPQDSDTIGPSDSYDRGSVEVCLARSAFTQACNRVEFLITREWHRKVDGYPYATEDPDDFGMVTWLVGGQSSLYPELYLSACDQDGGVP